MKGSNILGPKLSKKASESKRSIHIHFDANQQQTQLQNVQTDRTKSKNKNKNQDIIQSLTKKQKMDQITGQLMPIENKIISHQSKNRGNILQQIQYNKNKNISESNLNQINYQSQIQTLTLFKQFLFHSNRTNKRLINISIANKWIKSNLTTNKIKSILILYMILHEFQNIKFKFIKKIKKKNQSFIKSIQIQECQNKVFSEQKNQDYKLFYKNQFQNYLTGYVQWLIEVNKNKFIIDQKNNQFWALALNNCQQYAMQLLKQKNQQKKYQNVFNSIYLLNAQDYIFRSTVDIPSEHKKFVFMKKQNLLGLPKCHWILGLNITLKYFFKDFNNKVRQCLNDQYIEQTQIKAFYHEFLILKNYFNKDDFKYQNNKVQNFEDILLQWLLIQSILTNEHIKQQNQQTKIDKIKINKQICQKLFDQVIMKKIQLKQCFKLIAQLLQRQQFLSEKQKDKIFTDLFYNNKKAVYQFSNKYDEVIQSLQKQSKETVLPQFFIRISQQYTNNYKHRLMSQQYQQKNDIIMQAKHLFQIDFKYRDKQLKQKIHSIVSSFILISYWNKNISKKYVILLQDYVYKLKNSIKNVQIISQGYSQKQKQQQNDQLNKQIKQIETLITFLRINLFLQHLTLEKLQQIIHLYKYSKLNQSIIKFDQKCLNFIRFKILNELLNNNQNVHLIQQLKKNFISNLNPQQQNSTLNQYKKDKKTSIIQQLNQMAKGYQKFEQQINLIKFQAILSQKKKNQKF